MHFSAISLHHKWDELDYYHQRVNVQVTSRVAKRLKTWDLRKLGSFKKIPEMLGFDGEYSACHAKARFWCFLVKNRKKSPVKHFIENHILLNFVNLYTAFRPTIPGRNIPDNSFLIIFNPLPPKLQCWIWQNSPHSTLCFNSEIGGGENHELSGNFCQRLSELKKKKREWGVQNTQNT